MLFEYNIDSLARICHTIFGTGYAFEAVGTNTTFVSSEDEILLHCSLEGGAVGDIFSSSPLLLIHPARLLEHATLTSRLRSFLTDLKPYFPFSDAASLPDISDPFPFCIPGEASPIFRGGSSFAS